MKLKCQSPNDKPSPNDKIQIANKVQMPNKAQMPKGQTKRRDKHRPCGGAVLGLQSGSGKPHPWDLTCQGSTRVPSRD